MLRLAFERKKRGWSQSQLAERVQQVLGDSSRLRLQTVISRLELKQATPTDAELAALARVFEVSPAFVLLMPVREDV